MKAKIAQSNYFFTLIITFLKVTLELKTDVVATGKETLAVLLALKATVPLATEALFTVSPISEYNRISQ